MRGHGASGNGFRSTSAHYMAHSARNGVGHRHALRQVVATPPPVSHTVTPRGLRMKYLWITSVLGLALGLGLGPMVGAPRDAVETFDPNEPGALLATAATRLREFQYRMGECRLSDLIGTVKTAYWKQNRKG